MLDDKDEFGYRSGYLAMCEEQVRYWYFEWKPTFAFERDKKSHLEVRSFIKYFGPNLDYELERLGLIPYACKRTWSVYGPGSLTGCDHA